VAVQGIVRGVQRSITSTHERGHARFVCHQPGVNIPGLPESKWVVYDSVTGASALGEVTKCEWASTHSGDTLTVSFERTGRFSTIWDTLSTPSLARDWFPGVTIYAEPAYGNPIDNNLEVCESQFVGYLSSLGDNSIMVRGYDYPARNFVPFSVSQAVNQPTEPDSFAQDPLGRIQSNPALYHWDKLENLVTNCSNGKITSYKLSGGGTWGEIEITDGRELFLVECSYTDNFSDDKPKVTFFATGDKSVQEIIDAMPYRYLTTPSAGTYHYLPKMNLVPRYFYHYDTDTFEVILDIFHIASIYKDDPYSPLYVQGYTGGNYGQYADSLRVVVLVEDSDVAQSFSRFIPNMHRMQMSSILQDFYDGALPVDFSQTLDGQGRPTLYRWVAEPDSSYAVGPTPPTSERDAYLPELIRDTISGYAPDGTEVRDLAKWQSNVNLYAETLRAKLIDPAWFNSMLDYLYTVASICSTVQIDSNPDLLFARAGRSLQIRSPRIAKWFHRDLMMPVYSHTWDFVSQTGRIVLGAGQLY